MVLFRPYVFLPFIFFVLFGRREIGGVRIGLWILVGYGIAFVSEFSSVRTGFPYGWYYYVKLPTADKEIWVTNVPLWDSLSYVFLSYWSFAAARAIIKEPVYSKSAPFPFRTWIVAALLMTLADVVIDPVALQGDRWMLGTVYGYPEWGPYFGIPLENFAGWFLVSLAIIGTMLFLERNLLFRWPIPSHCLGDKQKSQWVSWIFYLVIVFANIAIAFYIKEYALVLCDLLIIAPILALILFRQNIFLPTLRTFRVR